MLRSGASRLFRQGASVSSRTSATVPLRSLRLAAGTSSHLVDSSVALQQQQLQQQQQWRFQSSYSSFREPGSLFYASALGTDDSSKEDPATTTGTSTIDDRDIPLRADVRTMGSLLGQIIQDHHGVEIFEKIEELRALAKKWRNAGAGRSSDVDETAAAKEAFDELAEVCSKLSNSEIRIIARAFTHFLAIANAAEGHHRIRLLTQRNRHSALPDKADSCGGVLPDLLNNKNVDAQTIYDNLTSQQVELVLTAHPTEVNRRSILEKQRRVQMVRKNYIHIHWIFEIRFTKKYTYLLTPPLFFLSFFLVHFLYPSNRLLSSLPQK